MKHDLEIWALVVENSCVHILRKVFIMNILGQNDGKNENTSKNYYSKQTCICLLPSFSPTLIILL